MCRLRTSTATLLLLGAVAITFSACAGSYVADGYAGYDDAYGWYGWGPYPYEDGWWAPGFARLHPHFAEHGRFSHRGGHFGGHAGIGEHGGFGAHGAGFGGHGGAGGHGGGGGHGGK